MEEMGALMVGEPEFFHLKQPGCTPYGDQGGVDKLLEPDLVCSRVAEGALEERVEGGQVEQGLVDIEHIGGGTAAPSGSKTTWSSLAGSLRRAVVRSQATTA